MIIDEGQITAIVHAAIDDLNKQLPKAKRLEKSPEAAMASEGGGLDSLGVVNLLFNTEKHLENGLGVSLSLTEEAAAADDEVFRTVGSYCDFVRSIAERQSHG